MEQDAVAAVATNIAGSMRRKNLARLQAVAAELLTAQQMLQQRQQQMRSGNATATATVTLLSLRASVLSAIRSHREDSSGQDAGGGAWEVR